MQTALELKTKLPSPSSNNTNVNITTSSHEQAARAPPHLESLSPPQSPTAKKPTATCTTKVCPTSPGQLDTLLPGYLSRPQLSPQKARHNLSKSSLGGVGIGGQNGVMSRNNNGIQEEQDVDVAEQGHGARRERGGLQNLTLLQLASARQQQQQHQMPINPPDLLQIKGVGIRGADADADVYTDMYQELRSAAQAIEQADPSKMNDTFDAADNNGGAEQGEAEEERGTIVLGKRRSSRLQLQQQVGAKEPIDVSSTAAIGNKKRKTTHQAIPPPEELSKLPLNEIWMKLPSSDACIAKLPLPVVVSILEEKLAAVCQVHEFLSRAHIQPHWRNIRQILGSLNLQQEVGWKDVELMSVLCPAVVHIHEALR